MAWCGAACSAGIVVAQEFGVPIRDAPGVEYIDRAKDAERGVVVFTRQVGGAPQARLAAGQPIHAHVSMKVPLEFWAKKTCEQVTCDYDHGEMMMTLYVDRAEVATHRARFYERDWEEVRPTDLLAWIPGEVSARTRTEGRFEEALAQAFASLPPGSHEIAISMWKLGHPSEAFVAGGVHVDVP